MSYPGSGQYDPYGGGAAPHQYGQQQQPYGQQQYGQQPNYGGGYEPAGGSVYGGLGAFGDPPKKNRTPIIVAVIALVAVAAGVGVYFAAFAGEDEGDGPPNQAAPPSNTSTAPTTTTAAPVETSTSQASPNGTAPVVPDWQVVVSEKEGVAFDVSDDWEVHSSGTVLGYEDDAGPRILMHGAASYRDDFCAGESASSRAIAGFQTAGEADPKKAPPIAAKLWATAAAEIPEDSDKVKPSAAEKVDVNGDQDAWMATATVQIQPEDACDPDKAKVTAVAFRPHADSDQTALFILVTDEEVDDNLPEDEAAKIIGSLRPILD